MRKATYTNNEGTKQVVYVHQLTFDQNVDAVAMIETEKGVIKTVYASALVMLDEPEDKEESFIQALRDIMTNGSMTVKTF